MPTTQIAAGRAFSYLDCLGKLSLSDWGFYHPIDVVHGANETLYVANWGIEFIPSAHITKCTVNHQWIADIGSPGTGDGQFQWPGGLALDSEENIYVTDQSIHKIVIFDKDGAFLGKWGEAGSREGELNRPSGIAFDKEDNLYVVDTRNHRLQKFSKEGKFLVAWGERGGMEGQLDMPWGITIDGQDNVYVADWGNNRVQKFTLDGEYLTTFGRAGTGRGEALQPHSIKGVYLWGGQKPNTYRELNRPSGVAVDKDGDVYIADWGNNRVQVYGPDGSYLVTLIGEARQPSPWAQAWIDANPEYTTARARANLEPEWRLHRPVAVTVDDDYRIIIAETQYMRLQVYLKEVEYEDPQFNL